MCVCWLRLETYFPNQNWRYKEPTNNNHYLVAELLLDSSHVLLPLHLSVSPLLSRSFHQFVETIIIFTEYVSRAVSDYYYWAIPRRYATFQIGFRIAFDFNRILVMRRRSCMLMCVSVFSVVYALYALQMGSSISVVNQFRLRFYFSILLFCFEIEFVQ